MAATRTGNRLKESHHFATSSVPDKGGISAAEIALKAEWEWLETPLELKAIKRARLELEPKKALEAEF